MKFLAFVAVLAATGVFAGRNCKCQDPSGNGPQWDDLTEKVCYMHLDGENDLCQLNKFYHGDQHNQCSSSTGCISSAQFNNVCRKLGAPGAFCW